MVRYLSRGPILQDGGGHLTLGRGDNIANFVKKKGRQLMLGRERVAHLVKKKAKGVE